MKLKLCVSILLSLSIFTNPTSEWHSEENNYWQEYLEAAPDGVVPENPDEALWGIGVESLLSEIFSAFDNGVGDAMSFFMMLLGIALIIATSESVTPIENVSLAKNSSAAISVISSVLIFGRIGALCFSVRESLESLSAFFAGIIPILTGILTAGGNINSSASQAFNMNVTLGAVSYLTAEILIPLVFALFALALAASVDGGAISSVAKGIKNVFMWLVGISTAVIIGAVSMQSVITGAQDSAYLRAAKYAASGMIPVVGSTVSGALSTLAGGLSYVKSIVGVSSVTVIVIMAISPLVTMLMYRLAFSLSITFLEFMGSVGGVRTFSAFRSSIDALISVYALSAVVYISEVVVFIKSGVNVFG